MEQLSWNERAKLWLRLGVFVGAAFVLWKFGLPLLSLLWPFVAGLVVAAILNPLVKWFQQKLGWPRGMSTIVLLVGVFAIIGSAVGVLGRALVREAMQLLENWSSMVSSAQMTVDQLDGLFQGLTDFFPVEMTAPDQTLFDWIAEQLGNIQIPDLGALALSAGEKAVSLSSSLLALLVFLLAAYFLTADYPYLRGQASKFMGDKFSALFGQVQVSALSAFGGYLKAQMLLSVGVFVILSVGFLITKQPYALLLALGLAVMDFIPIIGAGTVMVPWAVIALITGEYTVAIQIMVIWGIIVVFRRVMEPQYVGNQTGMAPVLSLMSIYVGMRLGGVLGMVLGPILTLIVLNLIGLGLFDGLRKDISLAMADINALFRDRPQ